jgi:hypothetical protein
MSSNDAAPWLLSQPRRGAAIARVAVAAAGSLAGAAALVGLAAHDSSPPIALGIPVTLLVVAAALAAVRGTGAQIAARSVWWSNLVLGALMSAVGNRHEPPLGVALAFGTGAALAFRATLSLGMILAVADAQALSFIGALSIEAHHASGRPWLLFACAAALGASIVGLYRLRVWGLALAFVGALAVGACALSDAFGVPENIARMFAATSALALLVPLPVFVAIARRRAPAPVDPRLGRGAASLAVALLMAGSVVAVWR